MTAHRIDPLTDPRWPVFLGRHPQASVFHGSAWLRALRSTYGFRPIAYTTEPAGVPLDDALVLCRVNSRLTGRRLVSVPFADHCEPLWGSPLAAATLVNAVAADARDARLRYVEIRPRNDAETDLHGCGFGRSARYAFHSIDLSPSLDELHGAFHSTSVRQMIRRAEREAVTVEVGRDSHLRAQFYELLLKTRRKHGLPPQPMRWFSNVARELGDAVTFRVATHAGRPVAAIVTTAFKDVHCHKYGCSDPQFTKLGGTQLLLWTAIQDAKAAGAREFDMGRSDLANEGLIRFKRRWGAEERELHYLRSPPPALGDDREGPMAEWASRVFSIMPEPLLGASGRVLYRHFA